MLYMHACEQSTNLHQCCHSQSFLQKKPDRHSQKSREGGMEGWKKEGREGGEEMVERGGKEGGREERGGKEV